MGFGKIEMCRVLKARAKPWKYRKVRRVVRQAPIFGVPIGFSLTELHRQIIADKKTPFVKGRWTIGRDDVDGKKCPFRIRN